MYTNDALIVSHVDENTNTNRYNSKIQNLDNKKDCLDRR